MPSSGIELPSSSMLYKRLARAAKDGYRLPAAVHGARGRPRARRGTWGLAARGHSGMAQQENSMSRAFLACAAGTGPQKKAIQDTRDAQLVRDMSPLHSEQLGAALLGVS